MLDHQMRLTFSRTGDTFEYILTLIVIYGPNKDDPIFFENLKDKRKNSENKPIIICGDWNLV